MINRADTTTFNSSNSINIDGTPNGLSYTWKYFGKARTTPQISEKFNELGCFPIELTVRSNKNGATHTTTQYIKLANHPPELTSLTSTIDSAKKDSQKVLVKVQANGAVDPDGVITSYIWYYTTESDPEPQNVQITQKNGITFVLPNITEKYFFGVILEDNDGAKMNSIESGQSPAPLVIDNSNGNIYLPLITLSAPKSVVNVGEKVGFSVQAKTIVGNDITNKSEYAWDFDGDGRIDEKSSSARIDHIYTRSGDYNMKVRVTNNGVSNTKYQTIHVKNKLKADVYGYRLPDGRIYLMNASEGSYDKAHWEIGSTLSDSLASVMIESASGTTGKLTISSNDTDVSTTDIDLSKIETISGTGVLYQSYPRAINDTIKVKNPSDAVLISMFGNIASNYAIDTDTMIDTSLDGTPDNDADNKEDASYADGSVYTLHDLASSNKKERKIQLSLVKDGSVIATRTITIILDYIASTSEAGIDLTGSGTAGLSQGDRAKLEELSKLIRELTEGDRIILMQRYNTLVENWNNTFDKAKSLIDIQEGIESGTMDTEQKAKLSKVVDELLIGDAQVTDEIGIAVHLIRDLIPAESPNHDILLAKLAEIESHPTLLDANRKLGTEMLVLIETDTTIPDKYKVHIKNQLSIIVNGGSASIPTDTGSGTTVDSSSSSGILGFIGGFVKIFFIIIGFILLVGIIGFIFYRLSRKDDNIGFQDFLIDSVFHSRRDTPVSEESPRSTIVVNGIPPLPKEDPLSNYAPVVTPQKITPIVSDTQIEMPVNPIVDPLSTPVDISVPEISGVVPEPENIPDWLKVPTTTSTPPAVEAQVIESTPIEAISALADIDTSLPALDGATPPASTPDDNIPDWIKQSPHITEDVSATVEPTATTEIAPPESERLPDWLMSSLQGDTVPEVTALETSVALIPDEQTEAEEVVKPVKKVTKKIKTTTVKKDEKAP